MFRVFKNPAIALFGVSATVSVLTLPLYFIAEKYQEKERVLQKKLKPKIDKIKAVFSGDEQYMILSTYYKQNNYHPIYAMRSTASLLIQIPFFIAAYSYLSHLEQLQGASFLFLKDLGMPDGILPFGNIHINVLPIFMTLINIVSGVIYTKGMTTKDRIQLYGMSLIFLLLLYNSPAGLVVYWTMNNIFSLSKNIIQKTKHPKTVILAVLFPAVLTVNIFLLFFHPGDLPNRLITSIFVSLTLILPFFHNIAQFLGKFFFPQDGLHARKLFPSYFYIFSCVIIFLLHGGIVPSALIASSVAEFSFVGSRTTPFPFILNTLQQGAGIFLFWPLAIYMLCSAKQRHILTVIMIILSTVAIGNVFLITENFGFLTPTMTFSEPKPFALIPGAYILNVLIVCIIICTLIIIIFHRKTKIILSVQVIFLVSLLGYGIINTQKIYDEFIFVREQHVVQMLSNAEIDNAGVMPEYTFSKTGKNVLLIMLDCAVGGYVPYILEEKPKLRELMSGFHWFSNSASFANHTLVGALPIYGGYEYTPVAVNKRDNVSLLNKQKEAYLLLPKIFSDNGYSVTVTDPPFDNHLMSNLAIFAGQPDINAKNLIGRYTMQYLREHQEITVFNITDILDNNLIRFSFFKSAPLFLRPFIYDKGNWLMLNSNTDEQITTLVIDDYAFLDALGEITSFSEAGDTYTTLYAHLPHNTSFLQAPDYIPVQRVTDKGTSLLSNDARFHLMTASFLLLGKWFNYLKEHNVYDNTRIILVADHGRGSANFPGNISLPNGDLLQAYNPLLMVKDFNAEGDIKEYDTFMTNGDTPLLVLEGLFDNQVNPFTGIPLHADKDNGITIATIGALSTYRHGKNSYNIGRNQWLYVKDNIFDSANWRTTTE
jgi:YidC/Oxa1 family membrane protein insertase